MAQLYGIPGKNTVFLNESEIVSVFTKATNENSSVCYCKECGKFLIHNEKFWIKNDKLPWTDKSMPLICTNVNKTFLQVKTYNGHEYRRCVCDECIKKKYPNYKGKLTCQSAFYTQYAFGVSAEDFKSVKDKVCKRTEENYIKQFGEEEGLRRWNEYRQKQSVTNTYEYKKEKYGWTKKQFNEYNKSRAVTLENLVKRYGEQEGKEKWDAYVNRQRYTTSIEYFIEKYGKTEGTLKWNEFMDSHYMFGGASNISQQCFKNIHSYFPKNQIKYATFGNEEIMDNNYRLDYIDKTAKVVIEFNGDYWHMNPEKYDGSYYNFVIKKEAKDIWERDLKRKESIEYQLPGYLYIVIWESDYKNDLEGTVNKVVEQIKKHSNNI